MSSVRDALEAYTAPFPADAGDWEGILRRAGAGPKRTRRRLLLAAALAAVLATLLATPAFGIRGLITGLFGRTNVPFTGKTAPLEIKRYFYDLGLGSPPSMAPHAIATQVRRVASFRVGRKTHVLWVAPTRSGGFCWQFSGSFTGCLAKRHHPYPLSVSYAEVIRRGGIPLGYPSDIEGAILTARAASLTIDYADRTRTDVPFYFVSKPIDAGFFFAVIPAGHSTWKTRPLAVVLRDRNGRVLARQAFDYPTAAQHAAERARAREQANKLRSGVVPPAPVIPSPPLPAPTAPLERGSGSGVTAVAGRNGVVVFDTTHASQAVKKLIGGNVAYGCFGRLPYNSEPVELGVTRTTENRVSVRILGMSPPFLGCDIRGTYGHRWPDRLHEHSAVEIPFTEAGRRYFADSAAARDLALFLRSDAMHAIRKSSGNQLVNALRQRYGGKIVRLATPTSHLAADQIGYVTTSTGTVYVEYSPTGRRFFVRVVDGRIKAQNVRALAVVF